MSANHDFWDYLFSLIPLKRANEERVETLLERIYSDYLTKLLALSETDRVKIPNWELFCSEQKSICDAIVATVSLMSQGMHSKAYSTLNPILNKLSKYDAIYNRIPFTQLFRMRKFSEFERKYVKAEDLFHIPFNQRAIIKTQRFSAPGYPCLYLGTSIYGCWEEMGRPLFDLCMTSRLELLKDQLFLFRLVFPERCCFEINETTLLKLPLILACMVNVEDKEAIFKPEYIIPQLVTEWVITTRCQEDGVYNSVPKYDGIMYSSIHSGEDIFNYPIDLMENLCLPAFDASSPSFCKVLSEMFQITEPTCYEYEVLNRNKTIHKKTQERIKEYEHERSLIQSDARISKENKIEIFQWMDKQINYCKSRFKFVEDSLSDSSIFPLKQINAK